MPLGLEVGEMHDCGGEARKKRAMADRIGVDWKAWVAWVIASVVGVDMAVMIIYSSILGADDMKIRGAVKEMRGPWSDHTCWTVLWGVAVVVVAEAHRRREMVDRSNRGWLVFGLGNIRASLVGRCRSRGAHGVAESGRRHRLLWSNRGCCKFAAVAGGAAAIFSIGILATCKTFGLAGGCGSGDRGGAPETCGV